MKHSPASSIEELALASVNVNDIHYQVQEKMQRTSHNAFLPIGYFEQRDITSINARFGRVLLVKAYFIQPTYDHHLYKIFH